MFFCCISLFLALSLQFLPLTRRKRIMLPLLLSGHCSYVATYSRRNVLRGRQARWWWASTTSELCLISRYELLFCHGVLCTCNSLTAAGIGDVNAPRLMDLYCSCFSYICQAIDRSSSYYDKQTNHSFSFDRWDDTTRHSSVEPLNNTMACGWVDYSTTRLLVSEWPIASNEPFVLCRPCRMHSALVEPGSLPIILMTSGAPYGTRDIFSAI